jgi:hypothetical protein
MRITFEGMCTSMQALECEDKLRGVGYTAGYWHTTAEIYSAVLRYWTRFNVERHSSVAGVHLHSILVPCQIVQQCQHAAASGH